MHTYFLIIRRCGHEALACGCGHVSGSVRVFVRVVAAHVQEFSWISTGEWKKHAYIYTCIHACIHAYMHTYTLTCLLHTYIDTYVHTYNKQVKFLICNYFYGRLVRITDHCFTVSLFHCFFFSLKSNNFNNLRNAFSVRLHKACSVSMVNGVWVQHEKQLGKTWRSRKSSVFMTVRSRDDVRISKIDDSVI